MLVDSPPLASVTDALLLARIADSRCLVVQHNAVDKRLVKRSVAALREVGRERAGRRPELGPGDRTAADYYYYSYRPTEAHRADEPAGGQARLTA